jgi:oligoribonuclease
MSKGTSGLQKMMWLDMEMTGLEPSVHHILEVCVVVTDIHFENLHTWESAVFQPPEVLGLMDNWCVKTHTASGLVARVPSGISVVELDQTLTTLAKEHFGKERIVLCGNSIGQDRKFVEAYLPNFAKTLHYRMLDVSSFKIVFENRYGIKYKKKNKHKALDDILESIDELKLYLSYFSAPNGSNTTAVPTGVL